MSTMTDGCCDTLTAVECAQLGADACVPGCC